ncbi:MAG TPA: nodulation protein NfeD [Candidatus Polarisedimenticolia bacterium]|nr:nodulation protein NfeD [Candidatus Polarisedimenticolia bacterium]
MTEGIPFQRGSRLRRVGIAATVALILGGSAALTASGAARSEPQILTLEVADAIQPVTAQYVVNSLREAKQLGCDLIILKLDTPGGLLSSTETIVKAITGSPVPVVVFVSGTHAASAGFFITIAADVAVMAPGTRFGAAHPVTLFGGGEEAKGSARTMMEKAENDAAAWVRTLAENRKRNVALAEEAVRRSRAFTEKEALKGGLIDYVCVDEKAVLQALDGKTIRRFNGGRTTLHLGGAKLKRLSMSARERFLSWIANPAILIFLLIAGAVGLYVEFTHPGLIFPGVIGAVALLCFALATQIIPINTVGLLLILLGIALFVLEIKITSYGTLTVGGIACLLLGGLMLFRTPGAQGLDAPLWTVASLSLSAALIMAFLTHRVLWAHRQRVTTGEEGLVGEIGEVLSDLNPEGRVFVHGESWSARSHTPVGQGRQVKVLSVKGMVLEVEELRH